MKSRTPDKKLTLFYNVNIYYDVCLVRPKCQSYLVASLHGFPCLLFFCRDSAGMLLDTAAPGQPHHDTLLIVMGDHGQTVAGDHGGGSADETDTVIMAFNVGKMRGWLDNDVTQTNAKDLLAERMGIVTEKHSHSCDSEIRKCDSRDREPGEAHSESVYEVQSGINHAESQLGDKKLQCSEIEDVTEEDGTKDKSSKLGHSKTGRSYFSRHSLGSRDITDRNFDVSYNQSLSQVDFTPLFSLLMGLPIPFGNLGKVHPHMWAVLANSEDRKGFHNRGSRQPSWLHDYRVALRLNAFQVRILVGHMYFAQGFGCLYNAICNGFLSGPLM